MTNHELKLWLRANSSGVYRPASFAADVIDHQEKVIAELRQRLAKKKVKLDVLRCDLVSCRGGVNGCMGSECRNPKWDRCTPQQAKERYGITN